MANSSWKVSIKPDPWVDPSNISVWVLQDWVDFGGMAGLMNSESDFLWNLPPRSGHRISVNALTPLLHLLKLLQWKVHR